MDEQKEMNGLRFTSFIRADVLNEDGEAISKGAKVAFDQTDEIKIGNDGRYLVPVVIKLSEAIDEAGVALSSFPNVGPSDSFPPVDLGAIPLPQWIFDEANHLNGYNSLHLYGVNISPKKPWAKFQNKKQGKTGPRRRNRRR